MYNINATKWKNRKKTIAARYRKAETEESLINYILRN